MECLWDGLLPEEVRALPEDLAAVDELLCDPALLAPIESQWQREAEAAGRSVASYGRPTISMQTYVRLMVIKHRTGWGYETLMREVADSLHLRRFCLIALGEAGAGRVDNSQAHPPAGRRRRRRDHARGDRQGTARDALQGQGGEDRSTVIEADVRCPTDSGLALDSARVLAREARKLAAKVGRDAGWARDRSRAIGRRVRAMSRTLGRRTGERKQQVLEFTEQAGKLVARSIVEARRLAVVARRRARGRGARAKLRQIGRLEQVIDRAQRVCEQIQMRLRGEPISDRLVSIFDPDARPIRKGKLGRPNEFGYVTQICEVTENTKRGARGLILPATSQIGNPREDTLLPHTVRELEHLGLRPREVALDGGFKPGPPRHAAEPRPRADVHRRHPTAGVQAHAATPGSLPHRRRGPHQPPQTRLRAAPQPAESPPRPTDLDRLGHPRLQPRHPRRPYRLRHSTGSHPHRALRSRRPRHRPGAAVC